MDRLKSFWKSSTSSASNDESNQNDISLFDRAENFISSSFRRSNPIIPTTAEFDSYLAMIGPVKLQSRKSRKLGSQTATLRPQLVTKCYKNVQPQYFNHNFEIQFEQFDRKRKINLDRQIKMQEQLDQVEVCLFNQITSRFDEVLSSLRTLESLTCIVDENQQKLGVIRSQNFKEVMKVTELQARMAKLLRRKKNMEKLQSKYLIIKQYADFIKLCTTGIDSSQTYYDILPLINTSATQLQNYHATRKVKDRVQEVEVSLRRSFSEKINNQIFHYLTADKIYKNDFQKRFENVRSVFEELETSTNGILDESAFGQEETVVVMVKRDEVVENTIINYMINGWKDGEYTVGKLKADLQKFLRQSNNTFLLDFRNFCDNSCRSNKRQIENPNLPNLLKEMCVSFCSKVYTYYFDLHKSFLLRYFALTQKCFKFVLTKSLEELTIEAKEKLKLIIDGFVNTAVFIVRIITQKLIQIVQTKFIHEGVDISDFKLIVTVLETGQDFIKNKLLIFLEVEEKFSEQSFLGDFFCEVKDKFSFKPLEDHKERKVLDYLNRLHKNSLTVQLKESLENQIWQPTDIPTFYYDSLHYLITGESLNLRRNRMSTRNQQSVMYNTSVLIDSIIHKQSFYQEPSNMGSKISDFRIIRNDIIIGGKTYKVTQTVLLMLQILEDYLILLQHFPYIKQEVSVRINQVIRSYNSSSFQLIVHAGAVALQKIKTKNITSRHLGLSSLCLSFVRYIIDCIEKRVSIQDSQKLKSNIEEHVNTILKKLNQILINKAAAAQKDIQMNDIPTKGTASIVNNSKILLQILSDYYEKNTLSQIFTSDILKIYVDAISKINITSRVQAESLKDDVIFFFTELKGLSTIICEFEQYRGTAQDVIRLAFENL